MPATRASPLPVRDDADVMTRDKPGVSAENRTRPSGVQPAGRSEEVAVQSASTVVLAISRQLGSGGSYIGQAVARRLRMKYVDREILKQAAALLGREDEDLECLEERVANAWVRLTRHLSLGPPDGLFVPPRPASSVYEEDLFRIERQVIREIAAREDCVIIGRAASFVLRDHPGLVRLFVHAPEAWRIDTLMRSMTNTDRRAIQDLVRRTDRDRANFINVVCGCDWANACHYDMTLNPAHIGLDNAADLVTAVVQKRLESPRGRPPDVS